MIESKRPIRNIETIEKLGDPKKIQKEIDKRKRKYEKKETQD